MSSDNKIYQENPHLVQWRETGKSIIKVKGNPPLHPNLIDPEYKFTEDTFPRTVCHWGQRKLFLTELDFLLKHSKEGDTVIYIGAAPGRHIKYLAELVDDVSFHLYDRTPFDTRLNAQSNIVLKNMYFDEETVYDYLDDEENLYTNEETGESKILFLSDIRTADTSNEERHISELKIANDMQLQKVLYEQLNPRKAHLKFRLPYLHVKNNPVLRGATTFQYLSGELMIQPFGRRKSTETRLIPDGPGQYTDWDLQLYSDAMFTHNYKTRVSYYENQFNIPGLDHCYDCTLEKRIWTDYVNMFLDNSNIKKEVENLSKSLNEYLAGNVKQAYTPLSRPSHYGQD